MSIRLCVNSHTANQANQADKAMSTAVAFLGYRATRPALPSVIAPTPNPPALASFFCFPAFFSLSPPPKSHPVLDRHGRPHHALA